MARGGARIGAGRKPGKSDKPHISQYWTPEQIKTFYEGLYERAATDARIAVWCGEQLSGKAVQPIGNEEGKALLIWSCMTDRRK
jgi:hypothetical protein